MTNEDIGKSSNEPMFTLADITKMWSPNLRKIIRMVEGLSLDQRRKVLISLVPAWNKSRNSFFLKTLSSVLNSPEEKLQEMINSFPKDEEEPIVVIMGKKFKPFEKAEKFIREGNIWSSRGILELSSEIDTGQLHGRIDARRLMKAPNGLFLIVNIYARDPEDFRELGRLDISSFLGKKTFKASFNEGDLDLEKSFRLNRYTLWDETVVLRKLITLQEDEQNLPVLFPDKLEEMRNVEFLFKMARG